MDNLFQIKNQEFKAQGTKYQVLLNFGICCRELRGPKVTSFRTCMRSFCTVDLSNISFMVVNNLYQARHTDRVQALQPLLHVLERHLAVARILLLQTNLEPRKMLTCLRLKILIFLDMEYTNDLN